MTQDAHYFGATFRECLAESFAHHDEAGARHLNVQKRRYCYGYLSQNLHCGVTRGVTRSCLRRLAAARCYAEAFVSTGRYQIRESWRKCPRLFPYCDVDSALSGAHSDSSPLRTLLRTLILLAMVIASERRPLVVTRIMRERRSLA